MARTEITVQEIDRDGIIPSYTQATVVDNYALNNASHKVFLHVKNASGSSKDVTIQTPGTIDGMAIPDRVVAVPDGQERMIGPFPHGLHCKNDSTLSIAHAVWIDYSATSTQLTHAAIKLPDPTY